MTLKEWLKKYHTRPQMIVALFMISVWVFFSVRSFYAIQVKNDTYVKQTADLLSLAFNQNNRVLAESILGMVLTQAGATGAEVCSGETQVIGANRSLNSCTESRKLFERIVEVKITGSGTQVIRARFSYLDDFWSIFRSLGWSLILVLVGIYFIQSTKERIAKDIFDPLINNLLGDKSLEINELNELRLKIKTSKDIEAEKAVMLAIRENNQQVAHDIRSPIAAISALVELMDLPQNQLKKALDQAVSRAKSVANFLLQAEMRIDNLSDVRSFNLGTAVNDIITEKSPLFVGGNIKYIGPPNFNVETKLSSASLARILSNVIDNSIHACLKEKEIEVELSCNAGEVKIVISDTGVGISNDVIRKVGTKGFSHRNNGTGTGRGVFSAIKTLKEIGGSFSLSSELGKGTQVTIQFPVSEILDSKTREIMDLNSLDLVLIDDEEIHRTTWEIWSSKNGFKIKTYSNVQSFFEESKSIGNCTPIFIDSNLGAEFKGEVYAERISDLGFDSIHLATSSSKDSIKVSSSIKSIIGKNPTGLRQLLRRTTEPIAFG